MAPNNGLKAKTYSETSKKYGVPVNRVKEWMALYCKYGDLAFEEDGPDKFKEQRIRAWKKRSRLSKRRTKSKKSHGLLLEREPINHRYVFMYWKEASERMRPPFRPWLDLRIRCSLIKEYKMVGNMNRKGNCWDNAPIESFWGRMKVEWIETAYKTRQDTIDDSYEYIWAYYNRSGLHPIMVTNPLRKLTLVR